MYHPTELPPAHSSTETKLLLDSDRRYFRAAAENVQMLGGTFSRMEGLTTLPGGCVFHTITDYPPSWAEWLERLVAVFRESGSQLARFYLASENDAIERELQRQECRRSREIGYGMRLGLPDGSCDPEERIEGIVRRRNEHSEIYRRLLARTEYSPDGHPMDPVDYADMEDRKVQSGHMVPYLYLNQGRALGAGNLDMYQGFARIKNVLVDPASRGQGIGTALVRKLVQIAAGNEARYIAAFALEDNHSAIGMYRACGFTALCEQFQWTRAIR